MTWFSENKCTADCEIMLTISPLSLSWDCAFTSPFSLFCTEVCFGISLPWLFLAHQTALKFVRGQPQFLHRRKSVKRVAAFNLLNWGHNSLNESSSFWKAALCRAATRNSVKEATNKMVTASEKPHERSFLTSSNKNYT